MPRPPARALIAPALCAGALLTASACFPSPGKASSALPAAPSTGPRTPSAAQTLTEGQARAALITEKDLGEPWAPTEGFATWRDSMLKASAESPECGRLLDALYTEDLFGPDARTRATVGLDDAWDGAQLRYQIVAHRPEDVDATLAWLGSLPDECGQFTAAAGGGELDVEVTEAEMPEVGDARQGLRVVLRGISEYDDGPQLTLHLAAVRVGDDAVTVTNGGLADVPADATWTAVELGARRLAEVRKQGRHDV